MLFDSIIVCTYCFILICLFTLSGQVIVSKFDKKLYLKLINPIIIGLSVFIILLYFLYHVLYLTLATTNVIVFLILLCLSIINYRINLKNSVNLIIENSIIIFPLLFFFIFLSFVFGENFYTFRGNHWDYFYYISQSILTNLYSYSELINLNELSKNSGLNDFGFRPYFFDENLQNIFFHDERTSIFLILGSFLYLPFNDVFYSIFIFKFFISTISSCALYSILNSFKNNKKINIIISIIFTFSFWNIYITETEALPQSLSIGFFLVIIYSYINLIYKTVDNPIGNLYLFFILLISFYLVYLDLFFVLCFFLFIHSILNLRKFFKYFKIHFKKIIFLLALFIIFVFLSYDNVLSPVLDTRIPRATVSDFGNIQNRVNLWGYYGSFILGKDSIITNKELINDLNNAQFLTGLDFIYKIISTQIENGYKFFFLNIFPSLTGLYYFGLPSSETKSYFFGLLGVLLINFILFKIFYKNIIYLLRNKSTISDLFTTSFISSLILIIYFLFIGQIFLILKLYISVGIVLFLFFVFDYSAKKKINIIYLVLIFGFVIYKFSLFNNGIGRYDTLPSIINVNYKSDFNWKINYDLSKCNKIENKIENYKDNKFQWIKYNYLNIKFFKFNPSNDKPFSCYIMDGKNKFEISTKKQ